MVQLIIGDKGKGKTKCILDKVNKEVKDAMGSICYIDKSSKHMFELNNRVRLINIRDYPVVNTDQFLGFIAGMIAQDHDLEQVYIDSYLAVSRTKEEGFAASIETLKKISDSFNVDFIISASLEEAEVPASVRDLVTISL